MAAYLRFKPSCPRLKSLLQQLRRFDHTLVDGELEAEFLAELGPKTTVASGHVDTSKWKKMNPTKLGISASMIPEAPKDVVRVLQKKGYDAYLVGGCVRDLLLSKTPTDFDVITTATLQEIKGNFLHAFIGGQRFPICRVNFKGSVIEVSTFEALAPARAAKEEEDVQLSKMLEGYDEKDIMRWRNSLKRDFTINSLFYDPFAQKIYDYASGITDLTFQKLRTLIPANLSFKEDPARILRGLRLAAHLGLSFAKDTEKEICNLCDSVTTLNKAILMMEMNKMLSRGAARASLGLLKQFNLLKVLLPFQAAYLARQSCGQNPSMLMELFFNLDSLVSCGQPCGSGLWVSVLAFHLALVNHPQHALVIWTLSSVLYHGNWKEGVKTARELAEQRANFVPEILESYNDIADEELAAEVAKFASIVVKSTDALTDSGGLSKAMSGYQSSPSSLLVFISKNAGRQMARIFTVLMDDLESLDASRHSYSIDYKLLRKSDIQETRFVLGKVIMDTMKGEVSYDQPNLTLGKKQDFDSHKPMAEWVEVEKSTSMVSELETSKSKYWVKRGSGEPDELNQRKLKKLKHNKEVQSPLEQKLVKEKIGEILSTQNIAQKNQEQRQGMEDVGELLSLQRALTQNDAKLERGGNGKAEAPTELLTLLKKAPTTINEIAPIVSNLETTESKDRVKRGSSKPGNEQNQRRPKKQEQKRKTASGSEQILVKEKMGKILSSQNITQIGQQQNNVVKYIDGFLSLQKKLTKKDPNLGRGKAGKASAGDILSVLQKVPKMMTDHKSESTPTISKLETPEMEGSEERASGKPEDELHQRKHVKQKQNQKTSSPLEMIFTQKNQQQKNSVKDAGQLLAVQKKMMQEDDMLERRKHGETEAPNGMLSVPEKTPQKVKEYKSEDPNDLRTVLQHSNLSESGKEPIEKDAEPEKEQKMGEQPPQNMSKLSIILKYTYSFVTNLFR